jgi:hypothetical protein
MSTTLRAAAESYLRAKALSRGTRSENLSTLRKWETWGEGRPIEGLRRKEIREFLDWVYERAVKDEGTNPGRTANKAREQLRAILSWEQELIELPPRFPGPKARRDVVGRHYLTKGEINALCFATPKLERPRGWDATHPIGRYWAVPSWSSSITAWLLRPCGSQASPRADPLASRDLGPAVTGSGGQTALALGVGLLSSGEDRPGVLPADEPDRQCAPSEHHARRPRSRRPSLPRRRGTPKRPLSSFSADSLASSRGSTSRRASRNPGS